jgi:hypothetical protein
MRLQLHFHRQFAHFSGPFLVYTVNTLEEHATIPSLWTTTSVDSSAQRNLLEQLSCSFSWCSFKQANSGIKQLILVFWFTTDLLIQVHVYLFPCRYTDGCLPRQTKSGIDRRGINGRLLRSALNRRNWAAHLQSVGEKSEPNATLHATWIRMIGPVKHHQLVRAETLRECKVSLSLTSHT